MRKILPTSKAGSNKRGRCVFSISMSPWAIDSSLSVDVCRTVCRMSEFPKSTRLVLLRPSLKVPVVNTGENCIRTDLGWSHGPTGNCSAMGRAASSFEISQSQNICCQSSLTPRTIQRGSCPPMPIDLIRAAKDEVGACSLLSLPPLRSTTSIFFQPAKCK